jgi:hypothetical protein
MKTCSAYFATYFLYCLSIAKENNEENIKEDFSALTKAILTVKCARPWATQNGQNEYNDQLQFEMTASFRKNQLAF